MGRSSVIVRPKRRSELQRVSVLSAMIGFACAASATAHDFWMQPNLFWLSPGTATPLTLQVGHGPLRQRSAIPVKRITRFEAIAPSGAAIDLRANLRPGGANADATIGFSRPGAYVLVLQTDDQAQSFLPAIRYNDYLKVEGLTPALELRARTHRTEAMGSENYSRQAKSIVLVGAPSASAQSQVTRPFGLLLEIVPEVSPYVLPRRSTLPVHVIFEGRRLAGALVKLTDLDHDESPLETRVTDHEGRAVFTMPRDGNWLLNVIWTKPQPRTRDTDFETTFSSLSFGLRHDDSAG